MGRAACALGVAVLAGLAGGVAAPDHGLEVVATGIPRPLQLALDREGRLLVLSPGADGGSAGEIFRLSLDGPLPVALAPSAAWIRIPFASGPRKAALGSLAVDPQSGVLFLGEENGTRIYAVGPNGRVGLYAVGLHRLGGGGTLAVDAERRFLIVDYVDRIPPSTEEPALPGFEWLRDEDYRGPLLFRLELDPAASLPRDLGRAAPFFPRAWGGRAGGGLLPRLISVAIGPGGVFVLGSTGEVFRVSASALEPLARLPLGQYDRTSLLGAPAGGVIVSGGFHTGRIFHVSPEGAVRTIAEGLADPQGIALDPAGYLYIAESARHRIVRLRLPR